MCDGNLAMANQFVDQNEHDFEPEFYYGTGMFCPECNSEMEKTDTTHSNMNTERAKIGQHTGNIFKCHKCEESYLENLLNGGKLESSFL